MAKPKYLWLIFGQNEKNWVQWLKSLAEGSKYIVSTWGQDNAWHPPLVMAF